MGFLGLGSKDREREGFIKINTTKIPFQTSIIEDPMLNLPAVTIDTKKHKYSRLLLSDLPSFVETDLNVGRIDAVQKRLWMCGVPKHRPLHRQKGYMGRHVVVTEQADLHLVWDSDDLRIFLKPLPAYLLNREFWKTHICPNEKTFLNALGFLRTYVHLIPCEIDLDLAIEERLLPKIHASGNDEGDFSKGEDITWTQWRAFVNEFLSEYEESQPAELRKTRWHYSELRSDRLNLVYRIFMGAVFRGYNFGYASYGNFLSRNSSWLIAAFAYVAIVHGAMQVGLGTPQLEGNEAFASACYGFAVFSIVAPVGILSILITWMVLMAVDNAIYAKFGNKKGDREKNTKRRSDVEAQAGKPSRKGSNGRKKDMEMHPYIQRSPPHQNGSPS